MIMVRDLVVIAPFVSPLCFGSFEEIEEDLIFLEVWKTNIYKGPPNP
jgi:hypothetical protein